MIKYSYILFIRDTLKTDTQTVTFFKSGKWANNFKKTGITILISNKIDIRINKGNIELKSYTQ